MHDMQPLVSVTKANLGERGGYSRIPAVDIYHIQLDPRDDETALRAHINESGDFVIDDLDVREDVRRNGLGKQMLRIALAEAERSNAERITSVIISAECLVAMRGVFGDDSIEVMEEGHFGVELGDTTARLNHKLGIG